MPLIPADARKAAKRGFLRTTSQAYATALAGGISATAILAFLEDPHWLAFAVLAAVTLVSPLAAGAASYLQILHNGIPEDYLPEPGAPSAATGVEREA